MSKVLVALSGGVDSSVAASLLLEQGYTVGGAFLRLFGDEFNSPSNNPDGASIVAKQFNIPFYVFPFHEEFKQNVIDPFCKEYILGRTPNPCIFCNKTIKFGRMLDEAISLGYDYLATGHYAKIEFDSDTNRYIIRKGSYIQKDQSYMLYSLSQEQLSHVLLPLGKYTKPDIRAMADRIGLTNAHAPDSQDICFIPDGDYVRFLTSYSDAKAIPGNFVDTNGNVLGQHKGSICYTCGQRRGLGISAECPLYVVSKSPETNDIILGKESDLYSSELIADSVNFVSIPELSQELYVSVKTRYSQKEAYAHISMYSDSKVKVVFDSPQRAITPGQSVVFYSNDILIGGGIIL